MNWTWAAFMPHPPIIVPEVGKGREKEAAKTIDGVKRLCARIRDINTEVSPEILLLLSPHEPYVPNALFVNTAKTMHGSLAHFGAPQAKIELSSSPDAIDALVSLLTEAEIPVSQGELEDITPDHGSLVPLYYLSRTFPGNILPPVVIANPSGLTLQQALRAGQALGKLRHEKRWALLASGDLSHRLKPGAPAGFHKDGGVFDKTVVEALKAGDPSILTNLDESVRKNAGECGLRPALFLLGLSGVPLEVFSYEGPFGVGYCNALWAGSKHEVKAAAPADSATQSQKAKPHIRIGKISLFPKESKSDLQGQARQIASQHASAHGSIKSIPEPAHAYARLARMAISAVLQGQELPGAAELSELSPDKEIWNVHKGCFVSIKNKNGSLRGCIGTFGPTQSDLSKEIIMNSIAASTRDPRFPSMKTEELDNVVISVDVLNEPELLEDGMELDPAVWGVIVSKGSRRGLLLPDLPTVTSVAQQLSIAAQKGGINDLTDAQIRRFTISRYLEEAPEESA